MPGKSRARASMATDSCDMGWEAGQEGKGDSCEGSMRRGEAIAGLDNA